MNEKEEEREVWAAAPGVILCSPQIEQYKHLLAFIFAVDEINKNPDLLPNTTIGYHIFDTCGSPKKSIKSAIRMLSGKDTEVPNYSCTKGGEVAAFVASSGIQPNSALIQFLSLYRFTQINYGPADPLLSDRVSYPTLYQIASDDRVRHTAIVKCLLYFGWNWVVIIAPDYGTGEVESVVLTKLMTQHGICIDFIIKLQNSDYYGNKMRLAKVAKSRAELSRYIENVAYIDHIGDIIVFNKRGEVRSKWNLINWVFLENQKYGLSMYTIDLATFYDAPREENVLNIDLQKILWKNDRRVPIDFSLRSSLVNLYEFLFNHFNRKSQSANEGLRPQSRCNEPCSPGYRKAFNGGNPICCYNCVPCSEGEVSNITDSEICHRCPQVEWPDEKKVKCIPKTYEFLCYEKDIISSIFLGIVVFLSIITLFILITFIYNWDTPIVKANNQTVSFILLVSILLSFLCVFFFLGRPVAITCLLRQTSFGIFFSIGVSSLLSKTITVCIAFKASKPGNIWVKWTSINMSYSVILVCSSVQVLICVIWLSVSPPYVEFDHHSYPGKIIIQCNEGSDLWFYSMLGYMGLLAAVSFLLAFMVRTLPDSFNEAKYITFSMLLFCSFWMAMIPAYLSTRGKYMVAVEIFAILTSCSGILGCIFLPKIYVLFLKSNLNSKKNILQRNKI
ncbi:vomeronasal type-2 receptor 26-like [Leptodactylus fuscus]|uniref:vomeronasal type-2 receptor 26-like n=1 Tax=Leptodactylus fuscus TaxID=238119 RepID=UPI003F4F37D9